MKKERYAEKERYWMVHNPDNSHPFKIHYAFEAAKVEAKRLAEKQPGQCFIILEPVGGYVVVTPEPKPIMIVDKT